MKRDALWVITGLLASVEALADVTVLKHDEFSSDLFVAVGQVQGQSLPVQPGFAQEEAYGLIFPIAAGSYPVKVLGIQMLFAAPPNAPDLKSHLRIEFYFDSSAGPAPSKPSPDWSVSTEDLYDPNTGGTGFPLQGGVGIQIDFDWSDPANHPPLMMSGNLWVVLRFYQAPQDLSEEWGSLQCMKMPEIGACGCQKIGVLGDHAITPKVNVVHHVMAGCAGGMTWSYAEDLGLTGDAIVRVKVETAGTCIPDCSGKQCGDDGCGGSCGACLNWCYPGCETGEPYEDPSLCHEGHCAQVCCPNCCGKECGPDGCGGVCGTCPAGKVCGAWDDVWGLCVDPVCTPDCAGKECGDGGCPGRPDACGTCGAAEACVDGQCEALSSCGNAMCEPEKGEDCSSCASDCGCGCGETCQGGACVFTACDGRECGDDGCGGACGECGAGEVCEDGTCVSAPDVVILEVSPAFGWDDEETPISVAGHGFQPGLSLRLGGTLLGAIQVVGEGLATAVVPAGMAPGSYTLFASNPDGSSGFLKDAFEVRVRPLAADEEPKDTGPVSPDVPLADPGRGDLGPGDPGAADTGFADTRTPAASGGGGGCSAGATPGGVPWWLALAGPLLGRRPRREDP